MPQRVLTRWGSRLCETRREEGADERMVTRTSWQARSDRRAGFARRALTGREREISTLETLLDTVRGGGSGALSIRGEPGVGKSALLEHLITSAAKCKVVRAIGVEGEVDLPYAGLQQLCRSMSDGIAALPDPQRDALGVAFGLSAGPPPDRFIVGLAALTLISETAEKQPVLCVIDDAQWLDRETTHALAFIARRLGADSVALVFATREPVEDLAGIPELHLEGLGAADARTLLESVVIGRVDESVLGRFLGETHGNPLALIELSGALTGVEPAAADVGLQSRSLAARIK
jgi:hypothetical protein